MQNIYNCKNGSKRNSIILVFVKPTMVRGYVQYVFSVTPKASPEAISKPVAETNFGPDPLKTRLLIETSVC